MISSADLASRPIPFGTPFDRILVPLDGSGTAERVLTTVRALYQRHASQVVLLRVVQPSNMESFPRLETETIADLYLRKVAAALDKQGVPVKTVVRTGEIARSIREVAVEEQSSMIALSTHGRMTSPVAPYGPTAAEILRSSAIPVLAVPTRGADSDHFSGTVLVPLTGAGPADDIVPVAAAFASSFGLDLAVLLELLTPARTGRQDAEGLVRAEEHLAKLATAFELNQIPTVRLAQTGDPVGAILSVAEERQADVIALGGAGGTLTEGVLRASRIPVLTGPGRQP
jgi:nucleotide-binding universal stress UspA family protein